MTEAFTAQAMRRYLRQAELDSEAAVRARAERFAGFLASVPAHLRDHPLVRDLAGQLAAGAELTAEQRSAYHARLQALLDANPPPPGGC